MTRAPEGWRTAALGDVCQIVSGSTPKTSEAAYWGGDIAWLTPNDLSRDRSQFVDGGERTITRAGYDSCSARLFPAGSVVISSRAPIGYVAIAGHEMCTNQGCKTAVPPDDVDSRYLYWFLVHARPDLEARASGTTFKEISGRRFAETKFWWPELSEQRRIVEVLEDHLSRLDAGGAALTHIAARASAWARARIDQAIWQGEVDLVPVGDLLAEKMRNGHSARAATGAGGVRTLTLTAVTRNTFSDDLTKVTSADPERVRDLWLQDGDILVQRSNTAELVGTSAQYRGPEGWAIFPDLLIRLRADGRKISSGYLAAVLRSERVHRQLRSQAKGLAGSMPKIDQAAIASVLVPLPGRDMQDVVVRMVSEAEEAQKRVDRAMQAARDRAQALRRSLLSAAFSGRLAA